MKSLALLVLAAIVATAGGFSLAPAARPSRRHAVASGRVRMQVDYDDEARTGETPAGEEPAKKKYSIEEEMAPPMAGFGGYSFATLLTIALLPIPETNK